MTVRPSSHFLLTTVKTDTVLKGTDSVYPGMAHYFLALCISFLPWIDWALEVYAGQVQGKQSEILKGWGYLVECLPSVKSSV